MTHTDPIKALVGLEAELKREFNALDYKRDFLKQVRLQTILAAIEALKPPASPAPVDDGERVRAAKIEAFDEALSIAEGSYSYGEQQNEIIAGIRAALAAINGEK